MDPDESALAAVSDLPEPFDPEGEVVEGTVTTSLGMPLENDNSSTADAPWKFVCMRDEGEPLQEDIFECMSCM